MIYILQGSDKSMIKSKLAVIKHKHHINDAVNEYDATKDDVTNVLTDVDSISIFDDIRMIVVNNCDFLGSNAKSSKNGYDGDLFIARKDSDHIIVLICENLDRRKKTVKSILKCSTIYSCIALDDKSLNGFLHEKMDEYGLKVDHDTFNWILPRIGYDPLVIDNEIKKLSIYASHPSLDDVKGLLTIEPTNNVFKMTDAFFDQNGLLLLNLYRNFRNLKMETTQIIALLAGQIRFMFQVRVYMDKGHDQETIASIMHAHPYRVKINMERSMRFSSDDLLHYLSILARLDQNTKAGKVDVDDGFEAFCLKLIQKKEAFS